MIISSLSALLIGDWPFPRSLGFAVWCCLFIPGGDLLGGFLYLGFRATHVTLDALVHCVDLSQPGRGGNAPTTAIVLHLIDFILVPAPHWHLLCSLPTTSWWRLRGIPRLYLSPPSQVALDALIYFADLSQEGRGWDSISGQLLLSTSSPTASGEPWLPLLFSGILSSEAVKGFWDDSECRLRSLTASMLAQSGAWSFLMKLVPISSRLVQLWILGILDLISVIWR